MDAVVARIASKQFGLVTRDQALAAGLSEDAIGRRVRSGRWVRLHPNVYRLAGAPDTWEQRILAAVLAAGPTAIASHLSAAVLWQVPGMDARLGRGHGRSRAAA